MNIFKHLFLDLDRTLWDFEKNSNAELLALFSKYKLNEKGISLPNEFIKVYKNINDQCWALYRENKLSKEDLRGIRFLKTLDYFGVSDQQLADDIGLDYITNSPVRTLLLDGCIELLDYLQSKYELHIITNGFEEVQHKKLLNSHLAVYFKEVITSEAAGYKKPSPQIFNYAIKKTGALITESVMIGDDLNTDIQGAINVNMNVIYFNPNRKKHDFNLLGDVSHLLEIKSIL
jgi:putative hydrolase of the HAD superfamily